MCLRKSYKWKYVSFLGLWVRVKFLCANTNNVDFRPLSYRVVQTLIGVSYLASTAFYTPSTLQCTKMLNTLVYVRGIFIPWALLFDMLECKELDITPTRGYGKAFDFPTTLKVPSSILEPTLKEVTTY